MTEQEYKVDKTGWPEGPWMHEPDKLVWVDGFTGLDCMIVRNPLGALCGYVGVKPDHPLYEKHYSDDNVELEILVHGGLTYSEFCQGNICHPTEEGDDHVWWFGFDCGHLYDLMPHPDMQRLKFSGRQEEYRDIEYVKEQVKSMAVQIWRLKDEPTLNRS